MKIESFLLGEIGTAAERSIPEIDDTTLRIPNGIMLGLEAPRAFDLATNQLLTTSGMRGIISRVLNGADVIQQICTLSRGIWKLRVDQAYSSNYQSTGANIGDACIRFTLDAGFTFEYSGFYAAINPGSQVRSMDLMLNVRGTCLIENFARANGVGQEHRLYTALLADKML